MRRGSRENTKSFGDIQLSPNATPPSLSFKFPASVASRASNPRVTKIFLCKTLLLCTEDSAGGSHSLLKISFNNIVKSVFTNSFVSSTKLYFVPTRLSTNNRSAILFIPALNTYHCCRIELDLISRNKHPENELNISTKILSFPYMFIIADWKTTFLLIGISSNNFHAPQPPLSVHTLK